MRIRTLVATFLMILGCYGVSWSQTDASQLYNTARSFMRSGDYANAILVLNQAIAQSPENAEYRKQLAFAYYLNNNLPQAEKAIKDVLTSDAVDVQTYQIEGNIIKARGDLKGAEKNYRRGLKKFPASGTLYNELGQIYSDQRQYTDALKAWTTGIKVDPTFASNYYNAAKTYYYSKDKVWTVLYGEIFIDLERYTARTTEMKNMLLAAYKDLFNSGLVASAATSAAPGGDAPAPDFRQSFLRALGKGSSSIVTRGITPETLVMLRTRFVLDWNNFYKLMFPFSLFAYQQQLLREGLFEAYNQWIFGPATNLNNYKAWVKQHQALMNRLIAYLNAHPLAPAEGQFYQDGKVAFEPQELPK
jgi:tetratricopeptide (TPR) repeat protein